MFLKHLCHRSVFNVRHQIWAPLGAAILLCLLVGSEKDWLTKQWTPLPCRSAVFLPSQTWSQRQRWQLCFCHHRLGHNGSTDSNDTSDSCVSVITDLITMAALTAVFLSSQTWSQWQHWQQCFYTTFKHQLYRQTWLVMFFHWSPFK